MVQTSRITYVQETAEKGESKHRDKGDCKVEDRGQGKDKQRKIREQDKKKEQQRAKCRVGGNVKEEKIKQKGKGEVVLRRE